MCVYIGEGNMKLHCCVAAYVSDYAFLGTALLPYPNYRVQFSASLDHAMWFHTTFRSDEWMLYECESPWAGQSGVHFLSTVVGSVCVHFSHSCQRSGQKWHFSSPHFTWHSLCCITGGCRGLVQGRLWRRDGVLAVSCSQEGVLRVKPVTESSKL